MEMATGLPSRESFAHSMPCNFIGGAVDCAAAMLIIKSGNE
jgi:hypothetical protein